MVWYDGQGSLETVNNLLLAGNTRRVDVVDTRTNLVGIAVLPEGMEKLHVTLRELNGDNIGVQSLDRGEDVTKVGVAEVGVGLSGISHTSGGEFEGVHSPLQVFVPVRATKRKLEDDDQHRFIQTHGDTHTLTNSRLVNLDGADAGRFEIDDLITESKSKLLRLHLARNIVTREGPVQDGDRTRKHALHG